MPSKHRHTGSRRGVPKKVTKAESGLPSPRLGGATNTLPKLVFVELGHGARTERAVDLLATVNFAQARYRKKLIALSRAELVLEVNNGTVPYSKRLRPSAIPITQDYKVELEKSVSKTRKGTKVKAGISLNPESPGVHLDGQADDPSSTAKQVRSSSFGLVHCNVVTSGNATKPVWIFCASDGDEFLVSGLVDQRLAVIKRDAPASLVTVKGTMSIATNDLVIDGVKWGDDSYYNKLVARIFVVTKLKLKAPIFVQEILI